MHDVTTITLDLDDTLWAIHPVIERAETALRDWLHRHRPRITERFDPAAVLAVRKDVVAAFPQRAHDLTFVRRTVLERLGTAVGYGTDFVDSAFAVFDEARNSLQPFPEVRPALAAIGRHYRIFAVTNGNADLDRIGLADLFSGCVTARDAGAAKPDPRIFAAATDLAGSDPARTLHVGDHPRYDVDGARMAGLRTAWVNRTGADWPAELAAPDLVVTDIAGLSACLPKLASG